MHELDSSADFDATGDREFFAAVPTRPAVFIVEPRAELTGAQPYLLRTANLRRRLTRLLGPPEPGSKRLNLREFAARVRYRVVGSPFELSFLHWQHARAIWPAAYRANGCGCVRRLCLRLASRTLILAVTPRDASVRADFISVRFTRAARRMFLPPDSSTCSRFAAARSKFAAIRLIRAACTRK